MNTEAWDEFIKLEEEANSILVGPSTAGRVGKYVSTRQRLKALAAEAPAKAEVPAKKSGLVRKRMAALIAASSSSLPAIVTAIGSRPRKYSKLLASAQALVDVLAPAAAGATVAVSSAVVLGKQPDTKAPKRKHPKRKVLK